MTVPSKREYITVEQYLASEERGGLRHEYVNGAIFAMTGTTRRHNIIAGNFYSIIRAHLRGSKCRVYISDVKARVDATNSFYYPDVMVSCEAYDKKSVFSSCPVLLIEVLSRSTAAIDRREKVLAYQQIDSLREYLIVHQTRQQVDLYRRQTSGLWELTEFSAGPNSALLLTSLPAGELKISMDEIYEDVDWDGVGELDVREDTPEYDLEEEAVLTW